MKHTIQYYLDDHDLHRSDEALGTDDFFRINDEDFNRLWDLMANGKDEEFQYTAWLIFRIKQAQRSAFIG